MSLLYKEVNELLMVETEGATVEPYEEGGLWAPWLYLWNILAAVVNDIVDVALDVLKHFLAPLFAFGRESRKGGEGFMRLNIAAPRIVLTEALERLRWSWHHE